MMLSSGPVLTAAILLSLLVSAQDNSFWRFIDSTRFSINTKSPVIPTSPTLELKPTVGLPTARIHAFVIGKPADVGKYPFMVFIELDNGENMCGGTLLSNSWILTAAHCLDGRTPTKILIGARTNDGLDPNAVTRTMQRKCSHKDFNPETLANDISLIKLSSPVTYSTYINKAKLPSANSKARDGSTGVAMGWGLNEHSQLLAELQEGEVEVVNKAQCVSWYSQQSVKIPDHHFCAGLGGSDTCGGDSGGPFVIKENGQFVLRGITSFGPEDCGQVERPGVYTRVSSYIDWINEKMHQPCKEHTWGPWMTECSVTCGTGAETSTRECRDENGVATSATNCPGLPTKTSTCTRPSCKQYRWDAWRKKCDVTCGTGVEQRRRNCLDELDTIVTTSFCSPGQSEEIKNCHLLPCPTYRWRALTTTCSVTCGMGTETKRRQCLDRNGRNAPASFCSPGDEVEFGSCNKEPCEVLQRYHWGPWRKHCSVTCGDGTELNFRQCLDKNGLGVASTHCSPGNEAEKRKCSLPPCSTGYKWGPWKVTCSVSCGRGSEVKTRQCFKHNRESVSVRNCKGASLETRNCDKPPCPGDSPFQWGPWKTWSRCRINTLAANRCVGFQSTTRDCLHMGRDVDPYRCISTIGGDYYREATCNVYGC